jgi:uncharacterized protein
MIECASVESALDDAGFALLNGLIPAAKCRDIASVYDEDALFRKRVTMARHGYGRGEYRYFSYPLPDVVARLRSSLYLKLAPIANHWNSYLRTDERYPEDHAGFLQRCHAAGQCRPTPLLLAYQSGDHNCLHQDRYGAIAFPLQVTVLLTSPEHEFSGGEFVLTEQRPRMQSRVEVVPLRQGDGVVFPVYQRPVAGRRGYYRVSVRHGVSRVHSGERRTLGIIFHDAT